MALPQMTHEHSTMKFQRDLRRKIPHHAFPLGVHGYIETGPDGRDIRIESRRVPQ